MTYDSGPQPRDPEATHEISVLDRGPVDDAPPAADGRYVPAHRRRSRLPIILAVLGPAVLLLAIVGVAAGDRGGPAATTIAGSSSARPSPVDGGTAALVPVAPTSTGTAPAATQTAPPPATGRPGRAPTPTAADVRKVVREGVPCSPEGALGMTRDGLLMRCGPSEPGGRDRWQPA